MILGDEESEFVIRQGLVWTLPALVVKRAHWSCPALFLHLWRGGVDLLEQGLTTSVRRI